MSASTADRTQAITLVVDTVPYAVAASTTILLNQAVCTNSSGYLVPASDTAGLVFVGYSIGHYDNSGGADGAVKANVRPIGIGPADRFYQFDASTATQAWVGFLVYFVDDHTVALAVTTTNDVPAGRVTHLLSASSVVVDTSRQS